jgi:hypothetical protein
MVGGTELFLRRQRRRFDRRERSIRLEGQRAVKAVAATGRGKPLRASTPRTDLARNKARRARAE